MNRTLRTGRRLRFISIVFLVALGIFKIPSDDVCAQDASGLSLKLYSGDPANTQNEYTLESDPRDPNKKYIIKVLLVLKNIANQPIFTERGFSQTELHRTLKVTDPCGQPLELDPEASPFTADAGKPRFVAGRALIPAETLAVDFVRSLTVEDLRNLFPEMYTLPGEYTVAAQLKGARFFVTEVDTERGLLAVANHRSNWFGIIEAKVGEEEKPTMTILILPVTGGRLKIKVEEQGAQNTQPLFGIPVKVFIGSLTQDPQSVWEATDMEPVLTGISETNGDVKWDCNKCLAAGVYTVLAKRQDEYQAIEINEANDGWGNKCSGQISQKITFLKESQPIVITGGAYNFPQDDVYDASFSMDVNSDGITHSGWIKYYYTKTRLNFVSTAITRVDVTANEATIQGTGTVNGQSGFTFEANVVDGTPDQFGLLIKDSQGDTIYSSPLIETSGGDLQIFVQTAHTQD